MGGNVIEIASVKARHRAARAASDASELAMMHAVKKMVDKIAADKASDHLSTSVQYLKTFAHLFN